jgi:hypothetical protein
LLTTQHIEESLCKAYVQALAGQAGVNLSYRLHDYGVDGTLCPVVIRGTRRIESGFPIDFQLKSTINWAYDDGLVIYDLEAKTYNDLVGREPEAARYMLILLCLPREREHWLVGSESEMILRHCCYWMFIDGDIIDSKVSKRIRIPRENLLTASSIHQLLNAERDRRVG